MQTDLPEIGQALMDAFPEPVCLVLKSGQVVRANRAASVFGAIPVGMDLRLRFRSPDFAAFLEELFKTGAAHLAEVSERLPEQGYFELFGAAVEGSGDLFLIVFEDRTALKKIERMRSDFVANASHELRTPLASIQGFIETLRGPARDDPRARGKFLDVMASQTQRMARLIDDLLSLSRLESRPSMRFVDEMDIRTLIDEVVTSLQAGAECGEMKISVGGTRLPPVRGTRDELFQVFENLIENACKYGRKGKRIDISLRTGPFEGRESILADITDYGPGIPAEHIPRLTERFYRVPDLQYAGMSGTGLGLSIVKHILNRHRGVLDIRSEPGSGSTFTVVLPLQSAGSAGSKESS